MNLADLMTMRERAGAEYARAALAFAAAAVGLKAVEMVIENGNGGCAPLPAFDFGSTAISPHSVYLPDSPLPGGVVAPPELEVRARRILAGLA